MNNYSLTLSKVSGSCLLKEKVAYLELQTDCAAVSMNMNIYSEKNI